jgi:hypothetical protein
MKRILRSVTLLTSFLIITLLIFTLAFAQGTSLQSPGVSGEGGSFLEKEAGICAYVKANKTLDINRAKSYFRTIEKEGPDFVVGSVPIPGYDTPEDAHMFIHKDGWIIAYYSKAEPVAKIIDWKSYQPGKVVTKLYQALANVAGGLGVSLTNVKYYHYAYPEANKLMIIVDRDSFKITIPGEIPIYEINASMRRGNNEYWIVQISVDKLTLDVTHTIEIVRQSWYTGLSTAYSSQLSIDNVRIGDAIKGEPYCDFFALFIIYQEK